MKSKAETRELYRPGWGGRALSHWSLSGVAVFPERIVLPLAVACVAVAAIVSAVPVGASEEQLFSLNITGDIVPPQQRTIRVTRGDTASIEATTDRPVVLHVHGLKLELEVTPAAAKRIRIPTRATGRFRVELHEVGGKANSHHHGAPLAYLEIVPK